MLYVSTRGEKAQISSAQAIKQGIATDGGLFVPTEEVKISLGQLEKMQDLSYPELASNILGLYLSDYNKEDLKECTLKAYGDNFETLEIAPLKSLADKTNILELWHGPTCAFKDMALQILPHLLAKAILKTGETSQIVILVATSGDTGKAALEGFKDVLGTKIMVFFPEEGVSQVQKLQMITQEGNNVSVVGVKGNFDDAQSGVKAIFTDEKVKEALALEGFVFSSANSINWGRLAPQIVYYFRAYLDLLREKKISLGEPINFVVPTGNFGDILAGFYAKKAGLPIAKLICASNENNILTDFINTGIYDRQRNFIKTISPSMDILISSNLERLLYHIVDRKSEKVKDWMLNLTQKGIYKVDLETKEKIQKLFWADYASEEETLEAIKEVWEKDKYVVDTHTAVALKVYRKYQAKTCDTTPTVIVSTASPFKFNHSVVKILLGEEALKGLDEFSLINILAKESGLPIPKGLRGLSKKPVLHKKVVEKEKMLDSVYQFLEL